MLKGDWGLFPIINFGSETVSVEYRCLKVTGGPPLSFGSEAVGCRKISMLKGDWGLSPILW